MSASQPYRYAKKEAIDLAERYADMVETNEFYWYTRDKAYFSLTGSNSNGEEIVVIIPESGDKVSIFQQSEGVTEAQALRKVIDEVHPANILKITLGFYEDEPVWEITAENESKELNYYLVSFKTGEIQKQIENI